MVEKFKIQNAKERSKLVRGVQVDDFPFEYGDFRFDVNLLGVRNATHIPNWCPWKEPEC